MDDLERRRLFNEMVADKIQCDEAGVIKLPIKALREFSELVDLPEDSQPCMLGFTLPYGEDGLFNYVFGHSSDMFTKIELAEVYFFDALTEEYGQIIGGKVLNEALFRDLYSGEGLICGQMLVDQYGGLYIEMSESDCIAADFIIDLNSGPTGVQFILSDGSKSMHVWSDGDTVYVVESSYFCYDGLPS